jgi:uncharacterized paraquat-inducible protein A
MPNRLAGYGIPALVLLSAAWLASEMFAQMSPGPLSKAHHDLNGLLQCAKCHVFGTGLPQLRCLDCHQEIAHRKTEERRRQTFDYLVLVWIPKTANWLLRNPASSRVVPRILLPGRCLLPPASPP